MLWRWMWHSFLWGNLISKAYICQSLHLPLVFRVLHPRKLTCPLKRDHVERKAFQLSIFSCLVFGGAAILPIFIGFTHKMDFFTYLTHEFTYQFHPILPQFLSKMFLRGFNHRFPATATRPWPILMRSMIAARQRNFQLTENVRIYSWGGRGFVHVYIIDKLFEW